MRLTRKKAIELCIELWTWLAKTGKHKKEWPDWEKWYKKSNDATPLLANQCWFCYYDNFTTKGTRRKNGGHCQNCPYYKVFGHCYREKPHPTYYWKWEEEAETPRTRKKYAKLFLEQIKTLV